jgi:hypothetical protein
MKSTSACDLIAVWGLKSCVRAPRSMAHLQMRPVASNCGAYLPIGNQRPPGYCMRRNNGEASWK